MHFWEYIHWLYKSMTAFKIVVPFLKYCQISIQSLGVQICRAYRLEWFRLSGLRLEPFKISDVLFLHVSVSNVSGYLTRHRPSTSPQTVQNSCAPTPATEGAPSPASCALTATVRSCSNQYHSPGKAHAIDVIVLLGTHAYDGLLKWVTFQASV